MPRFSPPAFLTDAARNHRGAGLDDAWSDQLDTWIKLVREAPQHAGHSVVAGPPDDGAGWVERNVFWQGYPSSFKAWFGDSVTDVEAAASQVQPLIVGFARLADGRYAPVERTYRPHDEYLEFHEHRGQDGRISKVTFTCDHADHWTFMAAHDLELVLGLYQAAFPDRHVRVRDIVFADDVYEPWPDEPGGWRVAHPKGSYDPWNRFNTGEGAVHTTHPSNTLLKAISLVVGASILREVANARITNADDLLGASGFGDPNRTSDPAVGGQVNELVHLNEEISLGPAPSIYISEFDNQNLTGADGQDVSGAWRVERGDAERRLILRAVFDPERVGLKWEDIRMDGQPLRNAVQLSQAVRLCAPLQSRPRPEGVRAPRPQRPVAAVLPHPFYSGYKGLFVEGESWPDPPGQHVPELGDAPTRIQPGPPPGPVTLDFHLGTRRWSLFDQRWSLLQRWSL